MDNKIISVIIAVTVGIIVVAGALMPVLNDAAAETATFNNSKGALYEMNAVDENSNYTFIWRADSPSIAEVNGESVKLAGGTILCSIGDTSVRFADDNPKRIQVFGTSNNYSVSSSETGATLTISVSGGEYTCSSTGKTTDFSFTEPITDGYIIVPKGTGSFVMKAPTQGAYVNSDSEIVGMGITPIGSAWNIGFSGVGTINGIDVTQYSGAVMYTIGPVTINSNAVDGYNDLYTVTDYQFDVTNPNDETVTHITYSYFIVPAVVVAEKTNGAPLDDYKGIVFTIPVIVIAALLIMAISLTRRY